ncbi:MAG: hypothetical protein KBC22_02915 [Candidatus Pacebacteria bacterium]|nr:hypothetical protein [Candidatus Paceibacterota bacterium]
MRYLCSLPHQATFTTGDVMGFVYSDVDNFPHLEALKIIADGYSGEATTGDYDRTYFVIVGEGEFTIQGTIYPVVKDDVIMLPKNTDYSYTGSMELFEVNAPAFTAT